MENNIQTTTATDDYTEFHDIHFARAGQDDMRYWRRRQLVDSLLQLASFVAKYPTPLPCLNQVHAFVSTKEELAEAARLGPCTKDARGDYFWIERRFGNIAMSTNIRRDEVCEKVKVGTRLLPATPAQVIPAQPERVIPAAPERTEDIFDYRCPESILSGEQS